MASYFEWAASKLSGAPSTACAFWIDVNQLLAQRNGGPLADDPQPISDDFGRPWRIVPYRANPFPARNALAQSGERTILWCIGDPTAGSVNLTPFEDYLGAAHSIVDVSIEAIAQEIRPELNVPRGLSAHLKGITLDAIAYVQALARRQARTPLTMRSALDELLSLTLGADRSIDLSTTSRMLASVAVAFASSPSKGAVELVRRVLEGEADMDATLQPLMKEILACSERDVVTSVYVGSAFARLGVANIGAVLSAEGFCPPALRACFEKAGGQWHQLGSALDLAGNRDIEGYIDKLWDANDFARLRVALSQSAYAVGAAAGEPLSAVRLAAILAHFEEFLSSGQRAATTVAVGGYAKTLSATDDIGDALRAADRAGAVRAPETDRLEELASAYCASPLVTASLDVARGWAGLRRIEERLSQDVASAVRALLRRAEKQVRAAEDPWTRRWSELIRRDIPGYLNHERQSWRRTQYLAESTPLESAWLVVMDGLRFDLWKAIVAPAVERAGWRVQPTDFSFSYLPSLTEVSRRTVVAGNPSAVRGNEQSLTNELAARSGAKATYALRTEHFEDQKDATADWNVRVFSWPDKFVHSDITDLSGLFDQFATWTENQFIPWLRVNMSRDARIAISTDHGFIALDAEDALTVESLSEDDRNIPRALAGARPELGDDGMIVPDGDGETTIATSRRWFRNPRGRRWHFAHGGSTLHETVVPYALLEPIKEGAAEITIDGLPAELSAREGDQLAVDFTVHVVGGTEMFPSVSVTTNLASVLTDVSLPLGVAQPFSVTIDATEHLEAVIVRVRTGSEQRQQTVKVKVALSTIKRSTLDLDV